MKRKGKGEREEKGGKGKEGGCMQLGKGGLQMT